MSPIDRKSTRLNSSHLVISYAVFCLKKKTQQTRGQPPVAATARSVSRVPARHAPAPQPRRGPHLTSARGGTYSSLPMFFFFLVIRRPRGSPLFPYPALSQ